MLAWYSIRILNFTEASLYTYIYKLFTLTRLTDRHWHCNSEQNSVNKIRLCLSVKTQNTLLDWLQTMDSGLFVWRDCDTWHMLQSSPPMIQVRNWCVTRNDEVSAEPHKCDLWWSNRFVRAISLSVSGTQKSYVQLFIWLTLLSLTCQDWLIISLIWIMRDLGQWILLVTYFCVHWSGHRGSGSNLAQLRLESAESVAWGAPGDTRTPDIGTRAICDQIRGSSLSSCMNSQDNVTGHSVIWFPESNEMLISL